MLIYGVFALGALCMLLGFFTVVRGIGASDSEATVKMFGVEFHASKLGPGLVFSVLGLILVVVAVSVEKTRSDAPTATLASGPAPANAPAAPSGQAGQAPAAAAPTFSPPVQPVETPRPAGMSHDEVAALLQDTLAKGALGYCPPESLEPALLVNCERNAPAMQQMFASAGPIRGVSYAGKAMTPQGEVDQYNVIYQNGAVTWKAVVTPARKFAALWNGPP
ncbi:hypothetical protein [Phenylobacterium sp.]|uniref:hypothetical protein n=1 Tax=Phenylobacterium sp. TaxID=1871053 RepID=UPI00356171B5